MDGRIRTRARIGSYPALRLPEASPFDPPPHVHARARAHLSARAPPVPTNPPVPRTSTFVSAPIGCPHSMAQVGWMGMMLVLLIVFLARQQLRYLLLLFLAAIYWVFWLSVPLVGYSWFYAWRFVRGPTHTRLPSLCIPKPLPPRALSTPRSLRASLIAPSPPFLTFFSCLVCCQVDVTAAQAAETEAHPVPFSRQTAQSLGAPFALCVYFGALCALGGFMLSSVQYARHLHLLNTNVEYRQQVFIEARRAQAAQARAGNAVARLLRLLPRSSRSRAQGGGADGADGSEHEESGSEHDDYESDEESGGRHRSDSNQADASRSSLGHSNAGGSQGNGTTDLSGSGGGATAEAAGARDGRDASVGAPVQGEVAADGLARVGSGIVLSARGASNGSRQPTAML